MFHIAALHRDSRNFEDPMEFNPDRFLLNDVQQLNKEGRFIGFGGGPRICLGELTD